MSTAATPRLWLAALVVCGLFVAEDPGVVAVRNLVEGTPRQRLLLDLALAMAMIAYNFAGSRYVVSVASGAYLLEAIDEVDTARAARVAAIRNPVLRPARAVIQHLNPFDLIKIAGDRLGRSINRAGDSVRLRRLHRTATVLEDLGAVNLLGVPGASLALGTRGHRMTRWHSLRHCVLFVASWFVGAHALGWLVGRAHRLPLVGGACRATTGAIGWTFGVLTDVTHPVGLLTVTAMVVAILRYATQVERTMRANHAAAAIDHSAAA